jgi:hypothetical protein
MDGLSTQLNYYRSTGGAPLVGAALTFFAAAAGGSLISALYAFAAYHNPLIYLNFLLLALFGNLVGWLVSKGVRGFQIRGVAAAALIAFAAFAVAYAVHWFFYVTTVLACLTDSPYNPMTMAPIMRSLIEEPEACWKVILNINEHGIWTLGKLGSSGGRIEVKGSLLTAIWILEALSLCWFSLKKPMEEAGKPYSERGGNWIPQKNLPARLAFIEDPEAFKSAAARGDYSALKIPAEGEQEPARYAAVTLYSDPFESYVSVENIARGSQAQKSGDPGKKILRFLLSSQDKKEESSYVVRYLKISPSAAREIENALSAPAS